MALVVPEELFEFPGAPFPLSLVEAASEAIQAEAGWHIAPTVTETIEIYTGRSTVVVLPSLRVESVTAVRDATDDALPPIEGWRLRLVGPVLVRDGLEAWPEYIEVDMIHGYEQCPADLKSVVAARAQNIREGGRVRQRQDGPFSKSFDLSAQDDIVARYSLPGRP